MIHLVLWRFFVIFNLDGCYSYLKFFSKNIIYCPLGTISVFYLLLLVNLLLNWRKFFIINFWRRLFFESLGRDVKFLTISNSSTETWINYHMVQFPPSILFTWLPFFVADWIIDYFIFYLPFIARKVLAIELTRFLFAEPARQRNRGIRALETRSGY